VIPLPVLEEVIDRSGIAPRIELLLPIGVRARQLLARTLLLGMLLVLADHRPAHLTRVHQALTALPEDDQRRLGVLADWKHGPHQLTYRQTERTFGLVTHALARDIPDGLPPDLLQRLCDDLLEASIPDRFKHASSALAVDWTDAETFSRPPPRGTRDCADPEASWGHRSGGGPGQDSELFFGYYASAATTMREENGPAVPELARRMTACSCRHDPARALVPVLTQMPAQGIPLGDVLADSGYAHRDAGAWAVPLRLAGARLVQDLHPADRGPRGTHHGAIISNGNLMPRHPPHAARTRTARPRRRPGPGRRPRPADRRDRTLQARPDHQRRRPRLPPGRLPRRHRQDPLPAPPGLHDPGPRPARDPHPARAPARLLHPADHHGATRGEREDHAKARLPLKEPPAVLRPAHRRRTDLLHRQGPRHQQHRPRLDPPHGPDPGHALAHLPARRPQPAHPDSLGHPPARQRPTRRSRPATQNPPPPPQNPHRPGHRRHPALTPPANPAPRPDHRNPGTPGQPAMPRTARHARRNRESRPQRLPTRNVRPKREDKCRSNVKTLLVGRQGLEP
jgi:hypothetical protein